MPILSHQPARYTEFQGVHHLFSHGNPASWCIRPVLVHVRSWVPQLFLVRTFGLAMGSILQMITDRPTLPLAWWFLKNLCSSCKTFYFPFPIGGGGSTSHGIIATNSRMTTFLLALGPRNKKEIDYTNNNFFRGRAALCTGGKVVTLGRQLQHCPAWLLSWVP